MLDAADLPDDVAALKAMLIAARLSEAAKDVVIASKDEQSLARMSGSNGLRSWSQHSSRQPSDANLRRPILTN